MSRKLSCRKYRGSVVAEWSKVVRIRKLVGGVDEARNEVDRRRDRDTYQSCVDVLAHLAHARRGGRCVCVVRLLRNGSKTKFFQQPGRFQARTRFLANVQGERVGRLPAHALHPPRKAHDTWHSAPNHWSHPPQRHVRGCGMLPSMSGCAV